MEIRAGDRVRLKTTDELLKSGYVEHDKTKDRYICEDAKIEIMPYEIEHLGKIVFVESVIFTDEIFRANNIWWNNNIVKKVMPPKKGG